MKVVKDGNDEEFLYLLPEHVAQDDSSSRITSLIPPQIALDVALEQVV